MFHSSSWAAKELGHRVSTRKESKGYLQAAQKLGDPNIGGKPWPQKADFEEGTEEEGMNQLCN